MSTKAIIGVIAILLLVVASIIIGNLFFSKILGVDVESLPPFLKFLVHMTGAVFVAYAAKKFLNK